MTPVGVTPPGVVTLTCWTCGEDWQMKRRAGQYPNRCLHCTATETSARRLLRAARTLGLKGEVHKHPRQGYVCIVKTPWHPDLTIVRDTIDLQWMLTELETTGEQRAAA